MSFVEAITKAMNDLQANPTWQREALIGQGIDPLHANAMAQDSAKKTETQQLVESIRARMDSGQPLTESEIMAIGAKNPELARMVVEMQNPKRNVQYMMDSSTGRVVAVDKDTGVAAYAPIEGGGAAPPPMGGFGGGTLPPPGGVPNPKMISDVQKGVTTDEFKNLNEAAAGARKRLSLLDQAETALTGLDTGALTNERAMVANLPIVGGMFGGADYAAKVQAAEAAIKPISKTFRAAGEGSTSDRDIRILNKSAPSVENQPEANRSIIAAQREQAKRDIDYSNTVQDLFNRGYTLPQAKQIYQEYANANPIFGGDNITDGINPNKVNSFTEWLAAGKPDNSSLGGKEKAAPDIEEGITTQFPDAAKGSDGNWYVKKDGQTFMVRPKQ